jgi:phosphohistidine phosphatase SixA
MARNADVTELVKEHRSLRRRPLYTPLLIGLALLLVWGVAAGWLAAAWGTTTVVLVRHAEKVGGDDPGLSDSGRERSERLASLLADAGIDSIYVSELRRTRETATPLASALGLEPVVVPAGDGEQLVERIRDGDSGDAVLVVGHSNTLPEIAGRLGAELGPVGDDDYGGLWVISVSRLRGTRAVALRY